MAEQRPAADYLGDAGAHGIYEALPEDTSMPESVVYTTRLPGDDQAELSAEEVEHFKREGFIVKHGLINEEVRMAAIVDYIWEHIPANVMDRNDPATWSDGPEERLSPEDGARLGPFKGSAWKIRSPEQFGTEPSLLDLTARHPNVLRVVRQFIGEPLRATRRARGIYAVFPKPAERQQRLGVHADLVPSHITAMVMLADVPPRSGGFTVWPGTHRAFHPFWNTEHGAQMDDEKQLAGFVETRNRLVQDVVPVECSGKAGDVVFWHPRLLHSPGINYSVETTPNVRFVVPCDFQRDGYTYFDDDTYGPGAKHQWWIDTRNYREDKPPEDDMWGDWAI